MSRISRTLALLALSATLGSCGAGGDRQPRSVASDVATPPVSASLKGGCAAVQRHELADVAHRIYQQSLRGRGVTTAVARLRRSSALIAAVSSGSHAAVRAAFLPLRHQIVRVRVFNDTRLLFSYGRTRAFAPIRGVLRNANGDVVGRFDLAVSSRAAYAGLVRRLTGARVTFRPQPARRRGHASGFSLRTVSYPSGPLWIAGRLPGPHRSLCASSPAGTRLRTIAYVGRRLLTAESRGGRVALTLRHAAKDPAFRRATAASNPKAIRRVIIDDFFRDHSFHIVRVRVTRGSRVIYDLGGPYVLQPASGTVRSPDGRSSARFTLAVQDDTGYIKLMHRFTGVDVQLRSPLGKVPGSSLEPGPDAIPEHGTLHYRGHRYLADSFDGTAFPSGRLRISLLVPTA